MKRCLTLLLLLLPLTACAAQSTKTPLHTLTLSGHVFQVELATNDATREQGLMNRTSLAANHGMLFVFPYDSAQTFWMKNTLIPLDMLFFDKDRRLVSMQLDAKPCKADPCALYPSGKPAAYVLELAAGTVAQLGLEVGDRFSLKGPIGPVH
jgi:uncharacterized membrane protein (UPF0127 family)